MKYESLRRPRGPQAAESAYELAMKCADLKRRGLDGPAIARVLGISKSHANNYPRVVNKLAPELLAAFRDGLLPAEEALRLASKDQATQRALWASGSRESRKVGVVRLRRVLAASRATTQPPDWKRGAEDALLTALGEPRIPGVPPLRR